MIRRLLAAMVVPVALLVAGAALAVPAAAGGGCHDGGTVSTEATGTVVVRMDGCTFAPTIDRVPVGTTVTFLNTSDGVHDVTGRASSWKSPILDPGGSYALRFDHAGIYPYSCSLHPGMAGAIVAGEVPDGSGAEPANVVVPVATEAALPTDAPPGASTPAPLSDDGVPPAAAIGLGAAGLVVGVLLSTAFAARRSGPG